MTIRNMVYRIYFRDGLEVTLYMGVGFAENEGDLKVILGVDPRFREDDSPDQAVNGCWYKESGQYLRRYDSPDWVVNELVALE
ncbi:MAG TPA: hypothetical protein VLL52_11240 [Anaerolineae bacterium]|nr:hypothetical protein [Anaerolineae bacterium]